MYYTFTYIWIAIAIIAFFFALKIVAPYGRHTRTGWGKMLDNRMGWIIYESPALILVSGFYLLGTAPKNIVTWILFSLFTIHYIHRTLIFPFRIRTKGKKIPLGIVVSAFSFNLVNGTLIGYYLGFLHNYSSTWLYDTRFIIGFMLFAIGMAINITADNKLIHLREKSETGYKIPYGGWFKYISCPNHFGEIIEWIGYAIMMWALPGWAFAIWTMANLIPRSLNHHNWYKEHFSNYPIDRKAVIPFVL